MQRDPDWRLVGVGVQRRVEGWQASIVFTDARAREHELLPPLRVKLANAIDDIKLHAPELLEEVIVCVRRMPRSAKRRVRA